MYPFVFALICFLCLPFSFLIPTKSPMNQEETEFAHLNLDK